MKTKLIQKAIVTVLLLLFIICFLQNIMANPIPIDEPDSDNAIKGIMKLFFINLPVNSILFLLFVFIIILLIKQKNKIVNVVPLLFIKRTILTILIVTLIGAIVDYILIKGGRFEDFIAVIYAILIILFSYFTSIKYIQKLSFDFSIIISICICLINLIFWYILFLGTDKIIMTLAYLVLFSIILYQLFFGSMILFYKFYKRTYEQISK